jgi:hypothetical protein
MKKLGQTVLAVLGLALLGGTVWIVISGTTNPSAANSVMIALSTAIAVPLGLASLATAWRLGRSPQHQALRAEAEAKQRAADALAQVESAKIIKAELQAYVAVRARWLEVERRRAELAASAEAMRDMHAELQKLERQLGVEESRLDPETVAVLDEYLRTRRAQMPDFFVLGVNVGALADRAAESVFDSLERRRLRRLAATAPGALPMVPTNKPGG